VSIHIGAKPNEIAETVLLPGDPLRGKWVAKKFLRKVSRYSGIRGMFGFTGKTSSGKWVSIQGSGMGMPSLSIYVNELVRYGVKRIIRIGSAGGLQKDLALRSVVLVQGSCSDSAMNRRRFDGMSFAPLSSPRLLFQAYKVAAQLGVKVRVGSNFATDTFYDDDPDPAWKIFARYGVLTIEMESAELFTLAAKKDIEALSILTISDNLVTGKSLSPKKRERSFNPMIEVALGLV
jgi:purine-nucleoside phosphorylase